MRDGGGCFAFALHNQAVLTVFAIAMIRVAVTNKTHFCTMARS